VFSLHGYPLIRTVHTGFSHFNCLSKLVITASEAGAMNTGVRHRAISKSRLAIAFRSSVLGVRMRSFCHDVVEIYLYYALRHAAFAAVLGSRPALSCNRTVDRSRRS
jgi:hypothetical protein